MCVGVIITNTCMVVIRSAAAYVSNRDENNDYVVHDLVHNAMKCHF